MTNKPLNKDSSSIGGDGGVDNLQLFKTTIDSSLDLIQVFRAVRNSEGAIVDFVWVLNNESSVRIYGDVIGKSLLQLQPGIVEEGIFDTFKQVVETGLPQQYEKHDVHEEFDGWFLQSVVKIDDGVATTTADITSRKKAEQELRESKTLLQHVIDGPRIGIAVYKAVRNSNGAIIDFIHEYINQASIEMLGGDDFTGRMFTAHGDNAREQMSQLIRVMETGEPNSYLREADLLGRKFWFAITNTRLDSDRLVHTWEDVTERKNAEDEIFKLKDERAQKAADKYRTLFETIDEGFAIQELLLDENGIVSDLIYREVNEAFEQHTGMKNTLGRKISEFVPHLEQHWLNALTQVYKTGKPFRNEGYTADLDRWFTFQYSRIGGPESRLVAVVFNDITERKRIEEALKEKAARQAYLLRLSDIIQRFVEPTGIKTAAMQLLGQHLGVSRAQYHECDSSGEFYTADGIGYSDGLPLLDVKYRIDDFGTFVAEDFRAGLPFCIGDLWEDPRPSAAEQEAYRIYQIRAGAGIPLLRGGKLVAILAVHDRHPHHWTDGEMELIRETAERVWLAVERIRAEEALRKSEEKYRTLFESVDEGFSIIELVFDSKGKVVDFFYRENNPAFIRHVGLDLSGKRRSELSFDQKDFLLEKYEHIITSGKPLHFEYSVQNLGGQWFEVTAARIGGEGSKNIGVIFRNITERKQQEEQQQFLIRFSDILRAEPDGDAITNRAIQMLVEHLQLDRCYVGICLLGDNMGIFPYQAGNEKVPPMPAGGVSLSDFPDALRTTFDETLVITDFQNTKGLTQKEKQNFAALGFGALVVANVRKGEKNPYWSINAVSATPRRWTGIEIKLLEEVTERTWAAVERARAEKTLRKSEEKYRTLFETMDEGFALAEVVYNEEKQPVDILYLEGNPAASRLTGVPDYNHKFLSEVAPGAERYWLEIYHQVVSTGISQRVERYMEAHRHWYDFYISSVQDTGNRVTVLFQDITERKNAQEALQQAQEAYRIQLEKEVRDRTLELIVNRDELQQEQHFLEQVTDKAPLLIYVYDLGEERFTYINKRVEALISKSEEYVYAMGPHLFQAILHPDDLSRYTAYMKGLKNLSGGQVTENDFRVWNGTQFRWFRSRDSVFREEKKHVLQVIGIAEDVTYERMLEEKLQSRGPIGLN